MLKGVRMRLKSYLKRSLWVLLTLFLTLMIQYSLGAMELWYISLSHVGSPNTLEDYVLWWFSLYTAIFFLPLWFFSARKTIRLFKNDEHWLTLSAIIHPKITIVISLILTGLMVWQILESLSDRAMIGSFDVPEYLEAAATAHMCQAMLWGLALIYTICLLVKQTRVAHRAKCEQ